MYGWQSSVWCWSHITSIQEGVYVVSTVVATYGFHWDKDEGSIPSGGRILGNCSEERAHMDQNMLNCQVNMVEKDGRSKGNRHCCSGVEESNVMRSKLGT
jgi:hypothetical protein